jgi:enoyl-CoA hydratase/carnithine racemase
MTVAFNPGESPAEVAAHLRGTSLWVTLTRPEAFNALTSSSVELLGRAVKAASSDATIRSLVITGSGTGFCAGADLKAVLARGHSGTANEVTAQFLRQVGDVFNQIESLPIPTIAAVNGITVAGGLELMLCCDIVIASAKARLGDGHANFGQIPGGGGTVRLPRRIGKSRAKHLMFTGQTIDATRAEAWGLVDEVCEPDSLESRVEEITNEIAQKSSLVLSRMKALVEGGDLSAKEQLEGELRLSAEHMLSHDRNEGLAAFTEKRVPKYLGR